MQCTETIAQIGEKIMHKNLYRCFAWLCVLAIALISVLCLGSCERNIINDAIYALHNDDVIISKVGK